MNFFKVNCINVCRFGKDGLGTAVRMCEIIVQWHHLLKHEWVFVIRELQQTHRLEDYIANYAGIAGAEEEVLQRKESAHVQCRANAIVRTQVLPPIVWLLTWW